MKVSGWPGVLLGSAACMAIVGGVTGYGLLADAKGSPPPAASAPSPSASAPVVPDLPLPAMVMITVDDEGYHASDIDVHRGQPVMFMIYNGGTVGREIRAAMPITSVTTDNPAATPSSVSVPAEPDLDVTIPPGQEVEVTFTPTTVGRFAIGYGSTSMGAVVVK